MIFYMILLLITISGVLFVKLAENEIGGLLVTIGIVFLLILGGGHYFYYQEHKANIEKYKVFQNDIKNSDAFDIRDATIKSDIMEWNQKIIGLKFWKKKIFTAGIFIPNEIYYLELIMFDKIK